MKRKSIKALLVFLGLHCLYIAPAIFVGKFKTGEECLPAGLKQRAHDDFLWPLSLIPRKANVFCGVGEPKKILGGTDHREIEGRPKPVPLPGDYQLSYLQIPTRAWDVRLPYFALTTKGSVHFRIGFYRWDDVDGYYTFPTVTRPRRVDTHWEAVLYYRFVCQNQKTAAPPGTTVFLST